VPTGEAALAGNPLLRVGGMAKQACSPPGWPSDAAAAQGFNDVAVRCLASAWTPLLDRAGMQYTPPLVFAPSGTFNTPCGSGDYTLYCSSNNGIYLPLGIINRDWDGFPFVHLAMVSHEFGHHVQELSGSLGEAWSQRRKVGTNSPAGLECFSGLFLGSVVDSGGPFTQSDLSDVIQAYIGDETHGTSANGDAWLMRGSENQIARCNTWVASSAEVA
jgi:predicted metalloprotease